jgi:cytochrome c553
MVRRLCGMALALVAGAAYGSATRAAPLDDLIATCRACHGENGLPTSPDIPIIWGQQFYYLYVQLKDFKAGRRQNETMSPIAAELEKDQMQALAQHFSEQAWPATGYFASDAEAGKAQAAASAGMCTQCHLGNYHGDSRIPRTAGQQHDYLMRTMHELQTRDRNNAPAMSALMESYSDADIAALADFLAGM